MSQHVKAAMLASKDLGKNERLVVLAIAAHANAAGDAWPSVATIAEYVGCSERTVQRCLAKLIQAGRLAARWVAGRATRTYRLIVDGVTSAIAGVTKRAAGVPNQAGEGDTQGVSPEGVEDPEKALKGRAAARNWRRFIPKNKPDPVRRGAALPPPSRTDQCPEHRGWLAYNCGPCRAEALAGGIR